MRTFRCGGVGERWLRKDGVAARRRSVGRRVEVDVFLFHGDDGAADCETAAALCSKGAELNQLGLGRGGCAALQLSVGLETGYRRGRAKSKLGH